VLFAADGMTNLDIAERGGLTRVSVGTWRRRYLTFGIEGIHDELRSGRPRTYSDEHIAEGRHALQPANHGCGDRHFEVDRPSGLDHVCVAAAPPGDVQALY
jgi:transposase